MKILLLASNPRGDLKLNEEIRDLQGVIERSLNREQLEVEVGLAVRPNDLQQLLHKHSPEIVHFCGHGTGEQGLVLQNDARGEQLVSTDALSNLFKLFSEQVGCILLNACYSEIQANALIQHINYVIGMSQEIRDDAAIAFATGFYQALGYGRLIEQSYEFGCNQIQLTIPSSGNSVSRSVVSEEQRQLEVADVVAARKVIPEHLKPILKKKASLTIISDSAVSKLNDNISRDQQVEIQLDIDRAFGKEMALKQYREKVREFLVDRKLTDFENIQLDLLKEELRLSDKEAKKILEEELASIRQAKQAYKKMLVAALIKQDNYPLSEESRNDLKKFQAENNLSDQEVEQISQPILKAAEVEYQGKLRQRYEQEIKQVIEAGYPIDEVARHGLKNLQQSLGLSDENVASIEQPIIAPKEAEYQQRLEAERLRQEQQELERLQVLERQGELARQDTDDLITFKFEGATITIEDETKTSSSINLQPFEFEVALIEVNQSAQISTGITDRRLTIHRHRQQAQEFIEDLGNGVQLEMVAIPSGSFLMGSPTYEPKRSSSENPQHRVRIKFFLGKYPVTQAQWQALASLPQVNRKLNPTPSAFKGKNRPVEQVSWYDAIEFCARLSQHTGKPYRLPSEAEWEYACRAGTTTPFHFGETITSELANYNANSTYGAGVRGVYREETTYVGSFGVANAFGLYDMHGNVWEWCADHDNLSRMLRGGSWSNEPGSCSPASRLCIDARSRPVGNKGFRVVCAAAQTQ